MMIVDTALRRRQEDGRPVKVAMIGAGAMGRAIARQILTVVPGMDLVAVVNRHPEKARAAFLDAGADEPQFVHTVSQLDQAIGDHRFAVTDDPDIVCKADGVDAVLEVTGSVEFGARVALSGIQNRKHIVLMNAELFATLGPILKVYADEANVVITDSDGDQPGVIMNLYRFVESIGCRPVLAGNIKGLYDPYRNPTTQARFADRNGLTAAMATSAADGTKLAFEMAVVGNATGFRVGRRGMLGPSCDDVNDAAPFFPVEELMRHGWVDYIVGARPSPGVFVLAAQDDPVQRQMLKLYKLGDGPLYTFYRPYHLCHFEVPLTVARAVLFQDAAVTPRGGPVVDVVATAKTVLRAGQILDGIGGYTVYGQCENSDSVYEQSLLPMGLAEGCRVKHDIPQDSVLKYVDVELPHRRLCDKLRQEQDRRFAPPAEREAVA